MVPTEWNPNWRLLSQRQPLLPSWKPWIYLGYLASFSISEVPFLDLFVAFTLEFVVPFYLFVLLMNLFSSATL
jgi:hypothetical protein